MVKLALLLGLLLGLSAGCGDTCPEVAMTEGPEGLVLTPDEHPSGWGEAECTTCHAMLALHRRGCSPGVDLAMVREQVEAEGLDACATCHGDNGVHDAVVEDAP